MPDVGRMVGIASTVRVTIKAFYCLDNWNVRFGVKWKASHRMPLMEL
jgi:hypothetical protein